MCMADLSWLTVVPVVTILLMGIALIMTVVSQSINRVVINRFLGWDRYHEIRREVSAFNKERMAATRANDQKQLDKLQKKQSQINALNAKMMKPQMLTMVLTMFTFIPWLVMKGFFMDIPVAYLPGFENGLSLIGITFISPGGGLLFFTWYMPLVFFVSMLMQRILGTVPVE